MNFYGSVICVVIFLALFAGSYWQGHKNGHNEAQVQWDAADRAAKDLADGQRKKDQAKAASLSKRLQAQVATQRLASLALADQLDAALRTKPIPASCLVDDSVRDNLNASLAGKGTAGAVVPATSGTTASVKDRPDGGTRSPSP